MPKTMRRPYFLWDYDLTEEDVRRILTNARFEDVWAYLTAQGITESFSKLRMRPDVKEAWRRALSTWGYHV